MKMYRIIFYLALFILLTFGYVKYLELRGIFYPIQKISFTPSDIKLGFEDVYFTTDDGLKINAWFVPYANAKYTLVFFHGNAGNIGDRIDKIILLNNLKLNIFIIDYRGFGQSQGKPSEQGLYLDAEAAYGYLINTRRIFPEQIILYGESLVAAAVINLAAKVKVKALILEGAFSSGKDMAKIIFPFIPNFFFSNSFNSAGKIKKIQIPKLFLHSQNDEIIPIRLSQKLFSFAVQPKYFFELKGGHNTCFLDSKEEYLSALKFFIDRL